MRAAFVIAAVVNAAALVTLAEPAHAQANRTFVSGHGLDSNPCSLTTPCRSFAQALSQTNAGGEITILDPAGYGSVTINKSVSIINDGVGEAGVSVTSFADGIDVSVGASDVVNLRGLTLVGSDVGYSGIEFGRVGTLNIQNCVIRGFAGNGLRLEPTGTAQFNISDTILSNIRAGALVIQPSGTGMVTAVVNGIQAIGSSDGVSVFINGANMTGALNVTIANSTVSNSFDGIEVQSTSGQAVTQVMVVNSVIANNNQTGIFDNGPNSTAYLAKTTISGNGTAFGIEGFGTLLSFGDNYIKSNGDDGGAIPLVSAK